MQLQFEYTEKIVAAEKYFDISRAEIVRVLSDTRECELTCDFPLAGITESGPDTVLLRLNISCTHRTLVESWTISLKMHKIRIDGIDFQAVYYDRDKKRHRGCHRNRWNSADEEANKHEPLNGFDDINSIEEFVIRSLKVMKVTLNSQDHGSTRLWDD